MLDDSASSLIFSSPPKLRDTKQKTFASYYVKSKKKKKKERKIVPDLKQLNPIHHELNLHQAGAAQVF